MLETTFLLYNYLTILMCQSQLIIWSIIVKINKQINKTLMVGCKNGSKLNKKIKKFFENNGSHDSFRLECKSAFDWLRLTH
jgi:hypothetical protein